MPKMDVRPLSPKLAMPYFVMAGEDDSLSDISCTIEHMNAVPRPKTLVMYAGEEHGMGGSRSSQLGAPFFPLIADWLADRAAGTPARRFSQTSSFGTPPGNASALNRRRSSQPASRSNRFRRRCSSTRRARRRTRARVAPLRSPVERRRRRRHSLRTASPRPHGCGASWR